MRTAQIEKKVGLLCDSLDGSQAKNIVREILSGSPKYTMAERNIAIRKMKNYGLYITHTDAWVPGGYYSSWIDLYNKPINGPIICDVIVEHRMYNQKICLDHKTSNDGIYTGSKNTDKILKNFLQSVNLLEGS